MTSLELVLHDPTNVTAFGNLMKRSVVAVSTSYSTLESHCKDTYGKPIGKSEDDKWAIYFTIQESKIIILQDNSGNKFG